MDLADVYVFNPSPRHLILHRGQGAVDVDVENWLSFGHGRLLKRPPAMLKLCAVVKIITLLPDQVRVAVIR